MFARQHEGLQPSSLDALGGKPGAGRRATTDTLCAPADRLDALRVEYASEAVVWLQDPLAAAHGGMTVKRDPVVEEVRRARRAIEGGLCQ